MAVCIQHARLQKLVQACLFIIKPIHLQIDVYMETFDINIIFDQESLAFVTACYSLYIAVQKLSTSTEQQDVSDDSDKHQFSNE